MIVPAITIVVLSFAGGSDLAFPPQSWSFIEYNRLFTDGIWMPAMWQSVSIDVPVTILALLVGIPAAIGLQRTNLPFRGVIRVIGLAPLVIPGIVYAIAMYDFYSQIGLLNSYWGLVLADTTLAIPFTIIILESALMRVPRDLDLVAMSLGATRRQALVGITIRLIRTAIVAAGILVFVAMFDETVMVVFLTSVGENTLPKVIFNSLRTGLDPSITAVGTFTLVISTGAILFALRLRRPSEQPVAEETPAATSAIRSASS